MTFDTTSVFDQLVHSVNRNRLTVAFGGSSSSKTYSALQLLSLLAISGRNLKIAVVTLSYPVFKRGLLPDLQRVLGPIWPSCKYNKVDATLTFPGGSIMYFVNASDADTAKGPRYDYAYFDELILMPKEFYRQTAIRTNGRIIATFNPSNSGSWVRELEAREDTNFIHSTFRDNQFLDQSIINELEAFSKVDASFRDVYLLGKWGSKEGLIFSNWELGTFKGPGKVIGVDAAFAKDHTVAVMVQPDGNTMYVKQIVAQVGVSREEIRDAIKPLKCSVVVDNSHPSLIAYLESQSVRVEAVKKPGTTYVVDRITHAQQFKLIIDPSSRHLINSLGIYSWQEKDGSYINKPNHSYSDAPDAMMYALQQFGFKSGRVRVRGVA